MKTVRDKMMDSKKTELQFINMFNTRARRYCKERLRAGGGMTPLKGIMPPIGGIPIGIWGFGIPALGIIPLIPGTIIGAKGGENCAKLLQKKRDEANSPA